MSIGGFVGVDAIGEPLGVLGLQCPRGLRLNDDDEFGEYVELGGELFERCEYRRRSLDTGRNDAAAKVQLAFVIAHGWHLATCACQQSGFLPWLGCTAHFSFIDRGPSMPSTQAIQNHDESPGFPNSVRLHGVPTFLFPHLPSSTCLKR